MRSASVVISIFLLSVVSKALPFQNNGIGMLSVLRLIFQLLNKVRRNANDFQLMFLDATKPLSSQRDLQTIDTSKKRAAEPEDADEAIAYAWITDSPSR